MNESLRLILTQFTDETFTISLLILFFLLVILIAYWFYNKRRFNQLKHQIPASVVKNYLDTIIQNSSALKSSLFRGGGLDVGEGIPSVMPTGDLPRSSVASDPALEEQLNQKIAQISSLRRELSDKDGIIRDLENRPSSSGDSSSEEIQILKDEVAGLRASLEKKDEELKNASSNSGGDEALKSQFDDVVKERDDLKARLAEYEIIEDELANLKRLQQENEELKKSLEALKGTAPAVTEPKATTEPGPAAESAPEEATAEAEPVEQEEDLEAAMAAAIEESQPAGASPAPEPEPEPAAKAAPVESAPEDSGDVPVSEEGEQKSAEELLSEFEKMLG